MESSTKNNEQIHFKFNHVLKNKLGLDNVKFDVAQIIPNRDSNSTSPRTIIARLSNEFYRDSIMKSTSKLKQTGIFIMRTFAKIP